MWVQSKRSQEAVDPLRGALRRETAQIADHDQVFEPGEMRVKMWFFRHVAHALLMGDQIAIDAPTIEENFTGCCFEQPGDHFKSRGFSRSVGAEVSGHFTGARRKTDVLNSGNTGKTFAYIAKLEHRGLQFCEETTRIADVVFCYV